MSNDILEEFIFDSREHLANAGVQLLALEKDPQSLADLNALMGTLHTIKGNSGFVNLKNLYNLLHAAETLLQTVREIGCLCPSTVVEELFQVLDTAEVILGRLEDGENDEVDWLPALNQALAEAEASLEESARAARAEEPVEGGPVETPALVEEPVAAQTSAPIALGKTVTLANGQLAEWGQSFLASCQAAIKGGQNSLAVDLTNLSQFSSQEMNLLVDLQKAYGDRLALVLDREGQPDFYRVLEVLGLTGFFRLFPDPEAALSALG
ncbi:MAG: Hpt domain-containing protein [Deltaproteobacteria bacterium]|jgi:chemotaxis protein histidine kinase CheA|nr:Hpt domain-containing protein [Deltaproteobacteria bacterium]